jgi:hypothetical protein
MIPLESRRLSKLELLLTVGKIYQLYTKYETIAGEQVRIVGTLAYSEISKVPYNVTVLAINERVIAVKDEDLETRISTDVIYHCRAVTPKPDGTYSEYIVWDSIINKEKTIGIHENYTYELNFSITDILNSPITQMVADIEKYITKMYPNLNFSITKVSDDDISGNGNDGTTKEEDKNIRAEAIIDALLKFENKLIPAAQAIIDADLVNKTRTIIDNTDIINANIQVIANNLD